MMKRNYLKEEEFVDEFFNWSAAAADAVNHEWTPDASCNDDKRKNQDYFLKSGEMNQLVFRSAFTHDDNDNLSAQILLESSKRIVNVKVRNEGNKMIAEIILDKPKT